MKIAFARNKNILPLFISSQLLITLFVIGNNTYGDYNNCSSDNWWNGYSGSCKISNTSGTIRSLAGRLEMKKDYTVSYLDDSAVVMLKVRVVKGPVDQVDQEKRIRRQWKVEILPDNAGYPSIDQFSMPGHILIVWEEDRPRGTGHRYVIDERLSRTGYSQDRPRYLWVDGIDPPLPQDDRTN